MWRMGNVNNVELIRLLLFVCYQRLEVVVTAYLSCLRRSFPSLHFQQSDLMALNTAIDSLLPKFVETNLIIFVLTSHCHQSWM